MNKVPLWCYTVKDTEVFWSLITEKTKSVYEEWRNTYFVCSKVAGNVYLPVGNNWIVLNWCDCLEENWHKVAHSLDPSTLLKRKCSKKSLWIFTYNLHEDTTSVKTVFYPGNNTDTLT